MDKSEGIRFLSQSKSINEWNTITNIIAQENGGSLPSWYYKYVDAEYLACVTMMGWHKKKQLELW